MNFELETLFKFQKTINEMQLVCIGISDLKTRGVAITRVNDLIEIYKTFDKFYYSAHFNAQKVAELQYKLIEAGKQMEALKSENEKLIKSLEWQT